MTSLKEVDENFTTARRWALALQTWTSTSFPRFLFVFSLLGVALFGMEYIYLNRLLGEDAAGSRARIAEVALLGKELDYKTAVGAITSCLDSSGASPKLHGWYCDQAVDQYRQVSRERPQARIEEVVNLLAYRAMREDVNGYLRGLKLQQLVDSPPPSARTTLKLILSNAAVAFWVFLVCALMVGAYLFLWVAPQRGKARSSA